MKSRLLKPLLAIVGILSILLPLLPAWSGIGNFGFECQREFGVEIAMIGARSQGPVHNGLFAGRFHAPAQRDRDGRLAGVQRNAVGSIIDAEGGCREDVQGQIHFDGTNEDAVYRAMLKRDRDFSGSDALQRPYVIFGFGRALTTAEWTQQQTRADVEGAIIPDAATVLQLPLWIEGIALAYNLSCPTGNPDNALHLGPNQLSGIFSGAVTRWSDRLIAATNANLDGDELQGLPACDQPIRVGVRADSSEQTTVVKDYMNKRDPQWRPYMERTTNTQWPPTLLSPCRAGGDPGMVTCVAGQPGSIGYVSFAQAFQNGLQTAKLQNKKGDFLAPSVSGCTEAGSVQATPQDATGDWSNVSLTDPPVGYAICSLQFAMTFQIQDDTGGFQNVSPGHTRTVKDYLKWSIIPSTQGQLETFQLSKLPENLRDISFRGIESIDYT